MISHRKLLLGVTVGALAGLGANALGADRPALRALIDYAAFPVGQVFLRLLFMLVVPMLFSALVMGVCEIDLRGLGRIGVRTLAYAAVVSTISVLIGLGLVNLVEPGAGVSLQAVERLQAGVLAADKPTFRTDASPISLLIAMVPDNPVKAAASGDMLGLIVFSLLFGVALAHTQSAGAARLRELIQGLYDVSMTLIGFVLRLAPLGVGALLFTMFARLGTSIVAQLAAYVGVVIAGLSLHTFVVYGLSVRLLGGRSPLAFFRDVRVAMLTAFSTASSAATLPTALRVAEEQLLLPRHVSRFVLTAGSAMNQNGTALFEGVTVLFLAQLYGVPLSLLDQGTVMIIAVLGGIGTAGVPAGSLPVIAMILAMLGIPAEGLGLVLGVDRLLDMCRTTVNVTGDLAAAVYVAHAEEASARS